MAQLVVTTDRDVYDFTDDVRSLREALVEARSTPDDDVIVFAAGVERIELVAPIELVNAGGVRIVGDQDGDGRADVELYAGASGSHFLVTRGETVTLEGLRLTGGNATSGSGPDPRAVASIVNNGSLTLLRTTIEGAGSVGVDGLDGEDGTGRGQAGAAGSPGGSAAAIANFGALTIRDSAFVGTVADAGDGGAGGDGFPGSPSGAGGAGGSAANVLNHGAVTVISGATTGGQLTGGTGGPGGSGAVAGADGVSGNILNVRQNATSTGAFADSIVYLHGSGLVVDEGDAGATAVTVHVQRVGDTTEAVTVDWRIEGAPTNGADAADFSGATSGRISFAAGESSKAITIPVAGDTDSEASEGFRMILSNLRDEAGGAAHALGTSSASGVIRNDDAELPTFSIVYEEDGVTEVSRQSDLAGLKAALASLEDGAVVDIVADAPGALGRLEVTAEGVRLIAGEGARGTVALGDGVRMVLLSGEGALNVTGNGEANIVFGNAGDNVLAGRDGVDSLAGGEGDDVYYVDRASDYVWENGGQGSDIVMATRNWKMTAGSSIETLMARNPASEKDINLTGNEHFQRIIGNAGDNVISGGGGRDYLTGGGGADTFLFDLDPSSDAADFVFDFAHGVDRIALDARVFSAFTVGETLGADRFALTTEHKSATTNLIFKQSTGQLFYDADGRGGGPATLLAVIKNAPALDASDFVIV